MNAATLYPMISQTIIQASEATTNVGREHDSAARGMAGIADVLRPV